MKTQQTLSRVTRSDPTIVTKDPHDIKPYVVFGGSLYVSYMTQCIISTFYHIFSGCYNVVKTQVPRSIVCLLQTIMSCAYCSKPCGICRCNMVDFYDIWYKILAMDQAINSKLMPIEFTELWFDIEDTDKVLKCIKKFFETDVQLNHKGTFAWEFYASKKNEFLLSPGYNRDSFRVDLLWFAANNNSPYKFFENFWKFCIENELNFRPHWGKWFPAGHTKFPQERKNIKTWSDYYASQYGNNWDQFKKKRKEYDPNGIFLTTYWKQTLGIETPPPVITYGHDEKKDDQDDEDEKKDPDDGKDNKDNYVYKD